MNLAIVAPLLSAAVTTSAAALAFRLARAPGWSHQRWFSLAAAGAAAYGVASAVTNAGIPDPLLVQVCQLQIAFVALQAWAWLRYADRFLDLSPGAAERGLRWALLGLAAIPLVPGTVNQDRVLSHAVDLLGISYRWAPTAPLGDAISAASLLALALVVWRFAAGWRRGVAKAGFQALALAALLVMGANDALVVSGAYLGPFLLDVAPVLPVVAVAGALASRFVQDARDLAALRDRLAGLAEGRGRALARSSEALHQSQRLAALGQFAAGLAHEVNNPASVVAANLHFIAEGLDEAPGTAELREAAAEAVEAMGRITGLVRRLADAGRLATYPAARSVTPVEDAVRGAVEEAQARFGSRLRWTWRVEPGLRAAVPGEVLHDLLLSLLLNAGEAVPEGRAGHVEVVGAVGDEGDVALTVQDDGRGVVGEVRERAFEPFFTTKPAAPGGGLGLPLARALVENHGGSLTLVARAGGGAEARLELPLAAEPATPGAPVPGQRR